MNFVIIAFGILVASAGVFIAVSPKTLLGLLRNNAGHRGLQATAVLTRLLLGASLVMYAAQSRFPMTLHVLGWIAIIAAVGLLAIGQERFRRLIEWASGFSLPFARAAGVVAFLFGAFLIYAVI